MTSSLRRPPALRPGDRVAVLSGSSPAAVDLPVGLDVLRAAGLEPIVYDSARDTGSFRPYLAGDDARRAGDLRVALLDPSIAGVWFACGGSGAGRTLGALDWTGLDALDPKVLIGYSDVTAFLEGFAQRLGWASVHGGMVCYPDEYAQSSVLRMVMSPEQVTQLAFPTARTGVGGRARGVTLGGNLCLLMASLGTPTSRPARGGILLLEDESEAPYRVDRMLTHLRRAGYLDGVAGIVCGSWFECGPPELIAEILLERLGDLGVPIVLDADVGHGELNQAFPIGIEAELDADARTLQLAEPPLVPL